MKPRTEEFNAKATKRSAEEFVLSRNLRRRHLSVGQKAAIALEWSEQIELRPDPDKNKGRGRPKGKSRDVTWFDSSVWTIKAVWNWSAAVQSWGNKTRFSIVELHDVSFTGIGCVQRNWRAVLIQTVSCWSQQSLRTFNLHDVKSTNDCGASWNTTASNPRALFSR